MWIIVEGPDFAGKSTLVRELEVLCNKVFTTRSVNVLHRGKPEESTRRAVLTDYVLSVEDYAPDIDPIMICDRWHFGEYTYAPIFRPETNKDGYGLLGKSGWRWTEMFLTSRGAVTVWLDQPLDVLIDRSVRGDDMVKVSQLADIHKLYTAAMLESPSYQLRISPQDDEDIMPALDMMLALGIENATEAGPLSSFPEYVGPVRPRALLVGDKRNVTKEYGEETLLTFMPVPGNSSEYLLEALPERCWQEVGLVNGNDMKHGSLNDLWTVLGEPRLVALGRQAERACREAGFRRKNDVVTIPHPAYAKRFRHHEKIEYGQAIIDAYNGGVEDDSWRM